MVSTPIAVPPALQSQPQRMSRGVQPSPAGDSESLRAVLLQYWHSAVRRKWLIVGIVATAVALGALITFLSPKLYTAGSQVEISREKKNVTNVEGVDGAGSSEDWTFFDTQYNLMKARSLAERVARNLNLAGDRSFFLAHGIEPLPSGNGSSAQHRKALEGQASNLLLDGLEVVPVENSSLVDIRYTSRDPQWSAKIANAWPREFIGATMDREFASNADARRFLQGLLDDLRSKLEQSERDVINFTRAEGIVKLGSSVGPDGRTAAPRTLVESNLEAANTALAAARTERIAAQSRLGGRSFSDPSSDGTAALLARRNELSAEYARLMVRYKPDHPTARSLNAQIAALDQALSGQRGQIAGSFTGNNQQNFRQALEREQQLTTEVIGLRAALDRQQRAAIQSNVFQREADTNRQLYDALLQRYKEVGVAGSVGTSNVSITDAAQVPAQPSSPDLLRNLLIALAIGLLLATIVVFVMEQVDERFRNPRDTDTLFGLPLLGSILRAEGEIAEQLSDRMSEMSEAYFSIRTTLAFATTHGFPSSLFVTSSEPGEGKSTSAIGLAMAAQRAGKRVLLIDADMRSPSVHRLVGSNNERGLSNLLSGEEDAASFIIRGDGLAGVDVLPAGPYPPSAAVLLGGERLPQLLDEVASHYDSVVVDGPPVLGLADALLLAKVVEGCIFVIEAERSGVSLVRNSLARLRGIDSQLFGAVVTKFNAQRYGYSNQYRYGDSAETAS